MFKHEPIVAELKVIFDEKKANIFEYIFYSVFKNTFKK